MILHAVTKKKLLENEEFNKIIELIDKFYIQYGLSINDLNFLINGLNVIDGTNT